MIYFVQCGENGPIKIGCTANVEDRLAQLQTSCPYELKLLWQIKGDKSDEADIHEQWKHEKIRGEWFHPSRKLLLYIEKEAANFWYIDVPDRFIEVRETKITVKVEGRGWSFLVDKNKKRLGLYIYTGTKLELNTDGKVEPLEIIYA